jgi:hypothetical protein
MRVTRPASSRLGKVLPVKPPTRSAALDRKPEGSELGAIMPGLDGLDPATFLKG